MFNFKKLYYDPRIFKYEYGKKLFEKYKYLEKHEIKTHWQIPEINRDEKNKYKWMKIKSQVLILGIKAGLKVQCGSRSCDFGTQSPCHGCPMACSYCYVARSKGYANPVTIFANIDRVISKTLEHASTISKKTEPTQADAKFWIYDIGGHSDPSIDALLSDKVHTYITEFSKLKNSKLTFSTKYVNKEMLNYNPKHRTRIRFSLMPQPMSTIVDLRTSKIIDRINAINDFYEAGYDVDINLAPVIIYPDWKKDYLHLIKLLNSKLKSKVKKQLNLEIIFLTHNEWLHNINLAWHPKAEKYLWQPDVQCKKISQMSRQVNYKYRIAYKRPALEHLLSLLSTYMPYAKIRYAF